VDPPDHHRHGPRHRGHGDDEWQRARDLAHRQAADAFALDNVRLHWLDILTRTCPRPSPIPIYELLGAP